MPRRLRTCPTCGSEDLSKAGLRNFDWVTDALAKVNPKLGGCDVDFLIEQSNTGRVLAFEHKWEGDRIPMGQRLTLKRLVTAGFDVWVMWQWRDDADYVRVGAVDKRGQVPFVSEMTLAQLQAEVVDWWRAGWQETA